MKFRMVDRILDWEPWRRIRGVKSVSFEEYRLPAVLGEGDAYLPRSLVLEGLVQLSNWLVMLSSDFSAAARTADIEQTRFHGAARPAHRIVFDAEVRTDGEQEIVFDGRATVEERLLMETAACRMNKAVLAEYYDPEDLRVLYSEIHRSGSF